MKNPRSFN